MLGKDKRWLGSFTIVIAHNLKKVLRSPSSILWQDGYIAILEKALDGWTNQRVLWST
jgi:hypothetical protein